MDLKSDQEANYKYIAEAEAAGIDFNLSTLEMSEDIINFILHMLCLHTSEQTFINKRNIAETIKNYILKNSEVGNEEGQEHSDEDTEQSGTEDDESISDDDDSNDNEEENDDEDPLSNKSAVFIRSILEAMNENIFRPTAGEYLTILSKVQAHPDDDEEDEEEDD